jgi:hypothetical protein
VTASLGVFNQVHWVGVGDVDECWIIATFWALVASGGVEREKLPSIEAFRKAAGRPDRPGPTGGNNYLILKALKRLEPGIDARLYVGGASGFTNMLKRGYIASLSVNSKYLPPNLQYGFKGAHQISVYFQGGKYYVMNPLAKEGSPLQSITLADLQRAAGSLFGHNQPIKNMPGEDRFVGDWLFHAVFIKAKPGTQPPKFLPLGGVASARPRDLNAPIIVRDYIDPYAARRLYDARHKDDNLLPE